MPASRFNETHVFFCQTARIWDYQSGDTKIELRGHENVIETIVFAPANSYPAIRELGGIVADRSKQPGLYAATGGRDKFIKIWDTSSGQLIRNLVSFKSTLTYHALLCTEQHASSRATITGCGRLCSIRQGSFCFRALMTRRSGYGSFRLGAVSKRSKRTGILCRAWRGAERRLAVQGRTVQARVLTARTRKTSG